MVYKVRHIPTQMFLSRTTYGYRLSVNGRVWTRKPRAKYFPRYVTGPKWFHIEVRPADLEIVEFQLVENKPRPFEPLGMTTADWKKLEPEQVDLTQLVFCQELLSVDALLHPTASYSGDDYPHIVVFEGKWYISDGHHRIARLLLSGYTHSFCRVKRITNPLTK